MIRRNLATLLTVISISANAQSLQELQKMKTEYEKIKNEQMNLPAQSIGQTGLNNLGLPTEAEIISNFELQKNNNDSLDFNLKYFGYDFFSKRDTINFWENLPTPKNYQLGPGDELIISIWGETQLRQTYIIDRDGNIYDEKIGLVSMIGHSLTTAEALLMKKFATIFSTLKIKNSSSYLNLSIGKLKSINVSFVGEVNYPGIYSIHPFSSLITGLIQAGGVDTTGTLRRIKIKRYDNKSKVINFDFYDYLLNGDISDEIQLRDKDVVLVSPRLSTITVDSAVFRPGIYEFLNGENLKQIVDFSGGLKPDASTTIGIERIKPFSQRNKSEEIRYNLYNEYSSLNKLKAQNGDFLTVHYLNKNVNKVEIIGKEDKPISFLYYKGMTLHDLIEISKIFYDKSFLSSVYQNKAEIARRDPLTLVASTGTING